MPVSGAVFAVKAALTAMTDERVRTAVLSVTAAICIPFFLIISVMVCFLSGTADHNRQAVFLSFYGSGVSLKMPEEYRSYVRDMQESFQDLDREIGKIKEDVREGTLDADMVKAYFYALFFGTEQGHMRNADYRKFAECFVSFEEIEDEEGNIVTVRVPVSDQNQICQSLSQLLGKEIRVEEKTNARRIYSLVKQGGGIGGEISGEAGRKHGNISGWIMCGEEAPRRPDLIAAVIFAGSIHSRGYVICPGQQRRGFMTSVPPYHRGRHSPEIWCFLQRHMLQEAL